MTFKCLTQRALLAGVLAAVPAAGFALGLGPMEGVPLIGRPLDVAVQVALDPGQDTANLCASAEVTQADVAAEGVTAQFENPSPTRTLLRVRTRRPIEEPVVSVTVNVGCFLKTSRKFVLFSDLPANATDAVPLQLARQLPIVPAPAAATASSPSRAARQPAARGSRARAQAEGTAPAGVPTARAPAPRAAASPRTPAAVAAAASSPAAPGTAQPASRSPRRASAVPEPTRAATVARAPSRSRLKLEPIDTANYDPQPNLRMTMSIDTVPSVTPQQRTEAAAVWRALNRTPVDVVQDYERLQAMSADLTVMRQHILSNKTELDAMRAQVKKSEDDRDRVTWILSAGILLLLLALAGALFWRRAELRARADDGKQVWWSDSKLEGEPIHKPEDSSQPAAVQAARAKEDDSLDLDLSVFGGVEAPSKSSARLRAASAAPGKLSEPVSAFSHLDFQASQPSSWKSLTTEELHDIQEQADFFVSLGDYDRAVNVLMTHVHASPHTSALAWMALLDLHHRLDRRQGYEGLRDQIERRMNVKVPEFDQYGDASAGLESYPDAINRIIALWPSARVLDVIEESIYRVQGGAMGEPFELAAFDELLLLHDVGKLLVAQDHTPDIDLDAVPSKSGEPYPMTSIVPLSAEISGPSDEDMLVLATLLAGSRVDINLDDAKEDHEATQPIPVQPDAVAPDEHLIEFDAFDAATARVTKN